MSISASNDGSTENMKRAVFSSAIAITYITFRLPSISAGASTAITGNGLARLAVFGRDLEGLGSFWKGKDIMATVLKMDAKQATNGGEEVISASFPYICEVTIEGAAPMLFHRWNCDAVEAKSKAAKGSAAKKSDDIESYVYRNEEGEICLPGEYLRQAIIMAAKFRQDPRSPRKSAMDLFKAAIVPLTELASLGVSEWDYEDRRRVTIQRNGITRIRPAMKPGWKATVQLMCNIPEYVDTMLLRQVMDDAGRLIGVGDFRPTFGRFTVANWEVLDG